MDSRIALALLGSLAVHHLAGQTATACGGQLVPLKPVPLISCAAATPVCVTDANGSTGHWVWGCPVPQPPAVQTDPTIPLRISPPHIMTPVEAAMEMERLRTLRLENQQLQQLINAQQQLSSEASVPSAELPAAELPPPPDGHNWKAMKDFEKSMILWHSIKPSGKFQKQIEKALDRFYSDPDNLSVPISEAFLKVSATIK